MHRGRNCGYHPRLERLEPRCQPACTAVVTGDTLLITGDDGRNLITLTDDGTDLPGNVRVSCDGVPQPAAATAIRAIQVQALRGNDVVSYTLRGDLVAGSSRTVAVNLGDGSNAFTGVVQRTLAAQSQLQFVLDGGKDRDLMSVVATANVAAGASLAVSADGNGGGDAITVLFRGDLDGVVNVTGDGGGERDVLVGDFSLKGDSSGALMAQLFGRRDDDRFSLWIRRDATATAAALGQLFGGPGVNRAVQTPGVQAFQIRKPLLVPL